MLLGAGSDILNTVRNQQPGLQNLTDNLRQEVLPNLQSMAFSNNTQQAGQAYLNNELGGKYLDQQNPYLNSMIDQTNKQVSGQVNSQFGLAGRTGGGANQLMLSQGLANADNSLRYQNYSAERQNQQQAASLLPSYQAAQFAGISPLLQAYQLGGQMPYYGTQALGNIGSLYSGYGQQKQPGGWGNDLLNAAVSAGSTALMMSDRRLKTNITKVGEAKDGLGIYEWNWKSDPNGQTFKGVIADEVKALRPWAYVPNFRNGYDGVNYAALGSVA